MWPAPIRNHKSACPIGRLRSAASKKKSRLFNIYLILYNFTILKVILGNSYVLLSHTIEILLLKLVNDNIC